MRMYCIADLKSHTFSFPFMAKNDEVAVRSVRIEMDKQHPAVIPDERLYFVGDIDLDTGVITVPTGCPEEVICVLKPYTVKKNGGIV
nr:MAG: nonstructural protein [Microviridae sp.]